MKIQLNRNIVVEGVHKAVDEIVEVAEDLGRYLLGTGAARKPDADDAKPAKAAAKPAEPAKAAAKGGKQN